MFVVGIHGVHSELTRGLYCSVIWITQINRIGRIHIAAERACIYRAGTLGTSHLQIIDYNIAPFIICRSNLKPIIIISKIVSYKATEIYATIIFGVFY